MRLLLFVISLLLGFNPLFSQGVTIGANTPPDPSATLEVGGSQGGFLLPRLSTTQRNAIQNPANGLQIYNTTTECVETWFPSGWKTLRCDCSQAPPQPGNIQGGTTQCLGASQVLFTVAPVPGAQSYQWTIDNQDTLVSGNGTDSILVNFSNQSGPRNISVTASNACGTSSIQTLVVTAANPTAAYTVTPNSPITNNQATFNATTPNISGYQWTFQNGTPASSIVQNPGVTWSNTGQFQVQLIVTDNNNCVDTLNNTVTVTNCQPQTWNFTTCGAIGRFGPSQSQCNSTYGNGVVNVTNGIQEWTVPSTGTYEIEVAGASGSHNGSGYGGGGRGAILRGRLTLNQGQTIKLLVGQEGKHGTSAGAGGGGSFVVSSNNTPLMIAGGGGSSRSGSQLNLNIMDGTTNTCGRAGTGGSGGCNGNGAPFADQGPGGAGFLTDGPQTSDGRSMFVKENAYSFLNGGRGGRLIYDISYTSSNEMIGGFGGGAAAGWGGSAGGGGYSGGGSGNNNSSSGFGGGGGSFMDANAQQVATSDGQYANSSNLNGPIQNLSQYNAGQGYITITRVCP